MSRLVRASVVATLLLASSLAAQYSERVDVSIASIDVVVRDKAGNLVRGLTRDDFELYEDGQLQKITNFSAIDVSVADQETPAESAAAPGATKTAPAGAVRSPRLLVLFFDVKAIDPASRKEFFLALRTFVDTAMRQGDFATVLAWTNRVRVVLPPTSNRASLDMVIDEFSNQGFGPLWGTLQRVQESRLVQVAEAEEFAGQLGMLPDSDQSADAAFEEFVRTEEICVKIKRKAREMRNLLTHLTKIEMKKVLLFASDDMSLKPSKSCDTGPELTALANTANAYGITIHGLHPAGARTAVVGPEVDPKFFPRGGEPTAMARQYNRAFDEAGGLNLLATTTGGVSGVGRQSGVVLKRAAEELDVYYSLGYSLSPGKEDKPRKVKVVMKNRTYRVRARDSVVRLSEGARLRDQIATNLYFPEPDEPQSPEFTAEVVRTEREGRLLRVAVELAIRSGDLFLQPGGNDAKKKGSFSVFIAGGRELGDASDVTELRQDFWGSPEGDAGPYIVYSFETRVRPDTRRLSLAVRDNNTGEVATAIVALKGEG
jgi:VWFA-related protein